jgi:hypothetical protein
VPLLHLHAHPRRDQARGGDPHVARTVNDHEHSDDRANR